MTDAGKTRWATIQAPYGRLVGLDEVDFVSGMRLLRVTIREGQRFTILDLDAASAAEWGRAMTDWAQRESARFPLDAD